MGTTAWTNPSKRRNGRITVITPKKKKKKEGERERNIIINYNYNSHPLFEKRKENIEREVEIKEKKKNLFLGPSDCVFFPLLHTEQQPRERRGGEEIIIIN